jgi:hypothetical protein
MIKNFLRLTILLSLCVLSVSKARGEEWVFYARHNDAFFYDRNSINNPHEGLKDVIGVWQKIIYDDESVDRISAHLGVKYADLAESISMIEIDCAKKMTQCKAVTFYDLNGKVLDTKNTTKDDWKEITIESPMHILYKVLCPLTQAE